MHAVDLRKQAKNLKNNHVSKKQLYGLEHLTFCPIFGSTTQKVGQFETFLSLFCIQLTLKASLDFKYSI